MMIAEVPRPTREGPRVRIIQWMVDMDVQPYRNIPSVATRKPPTDGYKRASGMGVPGTYVFRAAES